MNTGTTGDRQIGRYQVLEELGRGAMGVVYRGFDPVIRRTVALKTIAFASDDADSRALRERLYREAAAAGTLTHPNIVTIYDIIDDGATTAVAMEFVEGQTLADLLTQRGTLPIDEALSIFEQVCSALDYAGSKSIVHRDIKPANILLTADGRPKVMDFGIARIAMQGQTQTSTIMGSPSYMSPEQVRGLPLDPRSDLFSAAVVFYEMVAGTRPFGGDDVATTMYRIVNEPPRAFDHNALAVSPAVADVLGWALSKNPGERYQTGSELVAALRAAMSGAFVPRAEPTTATIISGYAPPPVTATAGPAPTTTGYQVPGPPGSPVAAGRPKALLYAVIGSGVVFVIILAIVLFGGGGSSGSPMAGGGGGGGGPVATVPTPAGTAGSAPATTSAMNAGPAESNARGTTTAPAGSIADPKAKTTTPPVAAAPAKGASPTGAASAPQPAAPAVATPAAAPAAVATPQPPPAQTAAAARPAPASPATSTAAAAAPPAATTQAAPAQQPTPVPPTPAAQIAPPPAAAAPAPVQAPETTSAVFAVRGEDYTGVRVFVDGRQVAGSGPFQVDRLTVGPHKVVYRWVSGPLNGKEIEDTVTLSGGGVNRVRATPDTAKIDVQFIARR